MTNRIIVGERASGKTTELIRISAEKQIPIVCVNYLRAEFITELAENMNLKIPKPIPYHKLLQPYGSPLLIDDVEDILNHLLRCPVLAMTTSFELTHLKKDKESVKFDVEESEISMIREQDWHEIDTDKLTVDDIKTILKHLNLKIEPNSPAYKELKHVIKEK